MQTECVGRCSAGDLIEEDLCGVGVVDALNLLGKDLFAPGRKVSMEKGCFYE